MEDTHIIKGDIIQPYRVEQGTCHFLFQAKDGTQYSLSDPERCMPAYSVAIHYTIEISADEQQVVACHAAVRPADTFPLPYAKLRTALTKKAGFGSTRLSSVFKGRTKGRYVSAATMVEYLDDEAVHNTALRLFDRHFQPAEYYVVACYLSGPQLLEKTQQQLQLLQTLLLKRPIMACFLSSSCTVSLVDAARGVYDMSLQSLLHCCKALKLKDQQEIAESESFQSSLLIYQRWQKEVRLYGSSQHKLLSPSETQADLEYVLGMGLVQRLKTSFSSTDHYCLLPTHTLGDGAVARYVLEHLSEEERQRRVITEFSYTPKEMPLLLVRHCGSNYYDTLKQLIRSWKLDVASTAHTNYRILCPSLFHAQCLEEHTQLPASVYEEKDVEEEEEYHQQHRVGMVVLDRAHLWDAKAIGRILLSCAESSSSMCVILCGDDRAIPVHATRGNGAIFSDLYRSGMLPVLYVESAPPGCSAELTELLLKGSRLSSVERVYRDIPCTRLEQFWTADQRKKLLDEIELHKRSVRILVRTPEQKAEFYSKLRSLLWNEKEWNSKRFYYNEVVYCRRLCQGLQAYFKFHLFRSRDCKSVCQTSYGRTNLPTELGVYQVSDKLILKDHSTGERYESALCYSDGLQPAAVDLYSRCQTMSHTDIIYVFIDRSTPWRLLYTVLLDATHEYCLLYDSEQEPDVTQLLHHIVEHNWKGCSRTGALFSLLSSFTNHHQQDEEEEGSDEPKHKKQKRKS